MKNHFIRARLFANKKTNKKLLFQYISYILTFILFIGYSVATSTSIASVHIFEKGNLLIYGFSDLIFAIFGQNKMIVFLLIIYFLNYESHMVNNIPLSIGKTIFKNLINVAIYLIIIYTSVFIAYTLICDINTFNLGFSDRSALRFILPAHWAISLSFVFSLFYLLTFSLITSIIEKQTSKSWLSVLISIAIAYVDIGIRFGFQSKELIGILLSDNISVFYLDSIFYGIDRPSYFYHFMYWIIIIAALCFVWHLLNKKSRIAGDNQ